MSQERAPLRSALELPLTALGASWAAMFSWRGFTEESGAFLVPVLVAGTVVVVAGALLRWQRQGAAVVVPVQVLVGLVATSLLVHGSVLPGRGMVRQIGNAFVDADTYASPVPHNDTISVIPLLIAGGVLALLAVDLVACTWRRVTLAGLPLLAIYAVPIGLLGGGLSWWTFALTALLFLLMLFVHQQQQVGRWGRALGARRTEGWRPHNDAVRVSATSIGAIAIVAAVVVPPALPSVDLSVLDIGPGKGTHNSSISITNPVAQLNDDLKQSVDEPLLDITSSNGRPDYLQISVLNRFSDAEWSSGDRQVPADHLPVGAMPPPPGLDPSIPRTTTNYQVTVLPSFSSTWLPTMSPLQSIEAPGDWRYDSTTRDFIAGASNLTTAGISYRMTGLNPALTADELVADSYRAPSVSTDLTDVPQDLPEDVRTTAFAQTSGATSPFEKAVALQDYFRNDFTYSLKAPPGDGIEALSGFLQDKSGYCQQFAAAMATMARVIGIPARVAVGFLTPTKISDNTWQYSTNDLHAWPELYFEGAGWVRFDPTPQARVPVAPAYTTEKVDNTLPTGNATAPNDVITKGGQPSDRPRKDDTTTTDPETAPVATASSGSGPWVALGVTAGAVVLAGLLALLPRTIRLRRRRRRLAGDAEDAWGELGAVATDLGLPFPADRSPRGTRALLVDHLGRPGDPAARPARGADRSPEAVVALDAIVTEVERSRYARDHRSRPAGGLAPELAVVTASLEAGVNPRVRRRALWWPRSVLGRWRRPTAVVAPSDSTLVDVERI